MNRLILSSPDQTSQRIKALDFCKKFTSDSSQPKYILGQNIYSASLQTLIDIDGIVDDYATNSQCNGVKIIKSSEIPKNALVLIASGGRPLSAKAKMDELQLESLDYFSFLKWSGLKLTDVVFNEGFQQEFESNLANYEWIHDLLADDISKNIFKKLISFRYTYDIEQLKGFDAREQYQYFEDFLQLSSQGESFVDIGCFNGFTSLEFIKKCPEYAFVHILEPDSTNFENCTRALTGLPNINFYNLGASNAKQTLKFDTLGSSSRISTDGAFTINVDKIDNIIATPVTFMKMDIEGAEAFAIDGARNTILKNHPKLAISVYHKVGDFWKIPKLILSIRDDYEIYLRHYTESIYESVMFFVPR